jgi:hypothetical protein
MGRTSTPLPSAYPSHSAISVEISDVRRASTSRQTATTSGTWAATGEIAGSLRDEQRDLQRGPRAVHVGGGRDGRRELVPGDPRPLRDLVRVGTGVSLGDVPRVDGADLVLDDAGGVDGAVPELGKEGDQRADCEPQLLPDPAPRRVFEGLPCAGVPAAGVRPDAGPGLLAQRPSGEQHLTARVEEVGGEGEVQRRGRGVHLGAWGGADRAPGVIDEDDVVRAVLVRVKLSCLVLQGHDVRPMFV